MDRANPISARRIWRASLWGARGLVMTNTGNGRILFLQERPEATGRNFWRRERFGKKAYADAKHGQALGLFEMFRKPCDLESKPMARHDRP